jgi:hypothetical protein
VLSFRYWKRWIKFYIKYNLITKRQVKLEKAESLNDYRLNIVIPKISTRATFGGIATALRFFHAMRPYFSSSRIIVEKEGEAHWEPERWQGWELESGEARRGSTIRFLANRKATLSVSKDDVFIASHWKTAILIKSIIEYQASEYNCERRPYVYLIQDFEPAFYNWSTEYMMVDSTYRSPGGVVGIFNTKLLRDYFSHQGYEFGLEYVFEPKIEPNLIRQAKEFIDYSNKQKIILIYGRPTEARNCFDIIVDALRIWAKETPGSNAWKIISAGDQHPDISLGNGCKITSVGKLSLDEYAAHLMIASVGVSLMVSPHPSYPPLEMAAFGVNVITNRFANKNLSMSWPNIVSLQDVNPAALAKEIAQMCLEIGPNASEVRGSEGFGSFCSQDEEFFFAEDLKLRWLEVCDHERQN